MLVRVRIYKTTKTKKQKTAVGVACRKNAYQDKIREVSTTKQNKNPFLPPPA